MSFCPFQPPEKKTITFGLSLVDLLVFSQHAGFNYLRVDESISCSSGLQPWEKTAFSNLFYIDAGEVTIQVPDHGVTKISAGEWGFVSSLDQPLKIQFNEGTLFHWIECDAAIWNSLKSEIGFPIDDHSRMACVSCYKRQEALVFKGLQSSKMQLQLKELRKFVGGDAVQRLKVASLSYELLSMTLETSEFSGSPSQEPCLRDMDVESLEAAARYLEENLDAEHSIQKLSRQFYINEFKLKKGFKERFDTTVFGFLRQKRMSHAKKLLIHSEQSVLEVANQVGYSNPSHFTRAFRDAYGVNPSSLRK